jgi:protein-L-isoaspartate(D-aspartate) O-methyltransferase
MVDYAALRKRMVEEQLIARGIKGERLLAAFSKVERHKFICEELRPNAYSDFPIPISEEQTISQPYIVALMTECLDLSGSETVLEIGTGSGYQTAILAELAKEVYSIERFKSLAHQAEGLFKESGYNNIKLRLGDGTLGWPEAGQFERIIITAASPRVPLPLTEQLKEGGRMVLPLGESFSQVLTVVEKKNNKFEYKEICGCVFVPLVGKYGWNKNGAA